MRYLICVVLLLGLAACESDSEKQARERRERQEQQRRLTPESMRMLQEMQQQMRQQQWAPPPQQPQQQPLVVCPECRGTGQSSRGPEAGAYPDSYRCQYCNGHGTIIAGQGRRSSF